MKKRTLGGLVSIILSGALAISCSGEPEPTVRPSPTFPKPTATYTLEPDTPVPPADTPVFRGIEGVDYPITSRDVDLRFIGVEFMERFEWEDYIITPSMERLPESLPQYDLLVVVTAESKNYTDEFPCEDTEYATAISIGFTMPETSRGGGSWLFCQTHEDGYVRFVFPTYRIATEYSIRVPGEPPFVNDIPLDSLVDYSFQGGG